MEQKPDKTEKRPNFIFISENATGLENMYICTSSTDGINNSSNNSCG